MYEQICNTFSQFYCNFVVFTVQYVVLKGSEKMIANRLNVLLAERELNILDVYKATKISRTTLTNLTHGGTPKADTLDKLCMFLHTTPDQFFIYSPYELNFSAVSGDNENEYKLYTNVLHYQDETLLTTDITLTAVQGRNYIVEFNNTDSLMNALDELNIIFHNKIKKSICKAVEETITLDNDIIENAKGKVYITYKMPWHESYQKVYSRV